MTEISIKGRPSSADSTVFAVIVAVSLCHFINDVMQSLLAAIYPLLKDNYHLDFWQIGVLTLAFQGTASLLQPLIGMYTDKRPLPYSLPVGMASSLVGLIVLAYAHTYPVLIAGAMLIGLGSAIFHPESSRVARLHRRPLRPGAVPVPARRQFRPGDRPAAGRLHRHAVRAGQHLLVRRRLAGRHRGAVAGGRLVCGASARPQRAEDAGVDVPGAAQGQGGDGARRADDPHLLEEHLRGGAVELLHLLRDRQFRRLGPGLAAHAVRLPRRVGGGAGARRADRRPLRGEDRHLVLDPRRAALHAGAAYADLFRIGKRVRIALSCRRLSASRCSPRSWCPAVSA